MKIQTVTPKLNPTILKRPLNYLVPLEVEPHCISEDPLVKGYSENISRSGIRKNKNAHKSKKASILTGACRA